MKKFSLGLAAILLLVFSCKNAKQEETTDFAPEVINEEEIAIAHQLIQGAFDDLWAGLDSTKITDYHTEDFIILENGHIWDNDRIKGYMRKKYAEVDRPHRSNRMEYISVDKYGPSIQIAYHNYAEFTRNDSLIGKAKWLESALAIPTDKGWRLKMMHSTFAGNDF